MQEAPSGHGCRALRDSACRQNRGEAEAFGAPAARIADDLALRFGPIEKSPDVIHRRVQHVALADPGRLAVRDDAQSLSYGVLDARANGLAPPLRARGVRPGVR